MLSAAIEPPYDTRYADNPNAECVGMYLVDTVRNEYIYLINKRHRACILRLKRKVMYHSTNRACDEDSVIKIRFRGG